MRGKRSALLLVGLVILGSLTVLYARHRVYVGYCTGEWGEGGDLLHYVFQCSCPQSMENIRVSTLGICSHANFGGNLYKPPIMVSLAPRVNWGGYKEI